MTSPVVMRTNNIRNITMLIWTNQILSTRCHIITQQPMKTEIFHITRSYHIVPQCDIAKYLAVIGVDKTTKSQINS